MQHTIIKGALAIALLAVCSCNQPKPQPQEQGVSKEELAAMLDSVKAVAKEEAMAEMAAQSTQQSTTQPSTSNASYSSSSSSAEPSGDLAKIAYKKGYDDGMSCHTIRLNFYTGDNEKQLKDKYMFNCRLYDDLGEENYNNRALYNEYRRGFFKGYEDGNNAL